MYSLDGGDFPGRRWRRYLPEDYPLLDRRTRRYVDQVLSLYRFLEPYLYLGEFGITASGIPPAENWMAKLVNFLHYPLFGKLSYGVMICCPSEHGLLLYTREGDGYYKYDLVLTDYPDSGPEFSLFEEYYDEHTPEEGVLTFLSKLFSDQLVAYRTYKDGLAVEAGIRDLSAEGEPIANWSQARKRRFGELTIVSKSWNGLHNQTTNL